MNYTPHTIMSRDIPLNLIDTDPNQPRKHFSETAINELAQSIEANGLAVPILVRPAGERYVIVHGERRYRAAGLLGWETIPANVRDIDADSASWLALVENVQRSDLSPIEEAIAYQERIAQGMTQAALAMRVGKTQSYIAQKIRLLKLPAMVQTAVGACQITEGHARQLLRESNADRQVFLCELAIRHSWTVQDIRGAVDESLAYKPLNSDLDSLVARFESSAREAVKSASEVIPGFEDALAKIDREIEPKAFREWIASIVPPYLVDLAASAYTLHYYAPRASHWIRQLSEADTLVEIKVMLDDVTQAQHRIAEDNLRVQRTAGNLLMGVRS